MCLVCTLFGIFVLGKNLVRYSIKYQKAFISIRVFLKQIMKKSSITLLIIFFGLVNSNLLKADNPVQLLEKMKIKYPDEMAIYLHFNRDVTIDLIGDSVKVESNQYYDMLHLNEQSSIFSKDKIFTSHFLKILNLEAKTMVPQKKRYKVMEVDRFVRKDEISSGIFYDDSQSTSFVFPAVQPGARTILNYNMKYTDPRFLSSYFFGSIVPVEETTLKLKVNKNIKINYKLFNCDNIKLDFEKSVDGNDIVYTWKANNLGDLHLEDDAPSMNYFTPHIIYYIEEANYPDGDQIKYLSGLEDLYDMYYAFVDNINQDIEPEFKTIVDSVTADCVTELDKVKSIFYWVQDNIKYIAFENGMRGFIPHEADLVMQKRYGDCKDMASILNGMLKTAGIDSYFTWVGSRDLPYKYTEVPTPQVDNHMITTFIKDGKYYFLDATSNFTSLGFPSSMIQGKQALLSIDEANYEVVNIPEIPMEANRYLDTTWIQIKGRSISGSGMKQYEGYPKIYNTYYLNGLDAKDEREMVLNMILKGNNKFFLDEYEIEHQKDRDHPLEIKYDFSLENYCNNIGEEIYVNLSLDKTFFNRAIEEGEKQLPIENEYKYVNHQITVLDIPEGYQVNYCPPNMDFQEDHFGFDISYNQQGNRIIQTKKVYVNTLLLDKAYFSSWNKMIESVNESYREVVILKKI